jgi:hypothetical protein
MRTTSYQYASLYHVLVSGRAMSGTIQFFIQTHVIYFCKKQHTLEMATYGAEFMVACQGAQQIIDLHYTLSLMGIPLDGPSWKFGDNKSVITSSPSTQYTLNKQQIPLSYHCVRKYIATKFLYLLHVFGKMTKLICFQNHLVGPCPGHL